MKYTPSAIVASLSGKTGGIVAASWKGVLYIRKAVIPKMGTSAGQVAARAAFVLLAPLYRSLSATIMAYLDKCGSATGISGFNVFAANVVPNLVDVTPIVPLPANARVPSVASFAAATGSGGTKTLACTWTDPALAGYTKMGIIARKASGGLFEGEILTTLASAATASITVLTAGVSYEVWGFLYNPTTGDFGTVMLSTATSHA